MVLESWQKNGIGFRYRVPHSEIYMALLIIQALSLFVGPVNGRIMYSIHIYIYMEPLIWPYYRLLKGGAALNIIPKPYTLIPCPLKAGSSQARKLSAAGCPLEMDKKMETAVETVFFQQAAYLG